MFGPSRWKIGGFTYQSLLISPKRVMLATSKRGHYVSGRTMQQVEESRSDDDHGIRGSDLSSEAWEGAACLSQGQLLSFSGPHSSAAKAVARVRCSTCATYEKTSRNCGKWTCRWLPALPKETAVQLSFFTSHLTWSHATLLSRATKEARSCGAAPCFARSASFRVEKPEAV